MITNSIGPKQNFLSLYIDYHIIEKKDINVESGRHDDAYAGIFCAAKWDTDTCIA